MKKKIAILCLVALMACGLCACGNENWGWGNYTFEHVHFNDGVTGVCADVDSWHDNELGCEVHTNQCGTLYLSEGTYILIEKASKCPFCNQGK
jgi:hypothetical protein